MTPKVVIIGIGFTSRLCLIRSLGQIGCDITVVIAEPARRKPLDCYSKYVRRVYHFDTRKGDEGLIDLLLGECADSHQKSVIITNNDYTATIIDHHQQRLQQHFLFAHIHHQQGLVVEWMNKERQKQLAHDCGIEVAGSTNVVISDSRYQLPQGIRYPCFTKTRAYAPGFKQTLHKCADEQELRQVLDSLAARYHDMNIMVEDYKEMDTEYAVVGVSDGKEVVIPGVIEILQMAKGHVRGVALRGRIMPTTGFEDLVERFRQMMLSIGFTGLFDIDFYRCGDVFYFGEINMRIGGSGYAVVKMGVNLPAIFVRSIMGETTEGMKKTISSSATYANERICMDNWYEGHLTRKEYRQLLSSSDISFVSDPDDPRPEKRLRIELAINSIKKSIKRLIRYHR